MASLGKIGSASQPKKVISFVIRDEVEKKHRGGINSLQYDATNDRLYTAGRDSIIRTWNTRSSNCSFIHSMEHHTDWVNDIVLCSGGKYLISASSDTTVKVWNAQKGFCMSTLRTHKDYVKALAYAREQHQVASAGLDAAIYLWDVNTLTALTAANNTVTTSSLAGCKDSIYCLDMNPSGTLVVCGSTEKTLRLWDPRTCHKLGKLKAHSDIIKSVILSSDGTQCLSGSSDGTIRLWSIGEQRCIHTIRIHSEGVWTLKTDASFSTVYSAGRDQLVWATKLRNTDERTLVCHEQAPVLRIQVVEDQPSALWVATTDSSVRKWVIPDDNEETQQPPADGCGQLASVIHGAPAIRKCHVLNDKRHVVTRDTDNRVSVYDVLTARKIEDLGKVDFDEVVRTRFQQIFIPNWFALDFKIGMLMIHLDQTDAYSAWVMEKDVGRDEQPVDTKVNYGVLLLQALLEHWPGTAVTEKIGEDFAVLRKMGNTYFKVPGHTPIIISESNGRIMLRVLVRDTGSDSDQQLLAQTLPDWVIERTVRLKPPEFSKLPFYLVPYSSSGSAKAIKKDRLSASDMLLIIKVMEHVLEKIVAQESGAGSGSAGTGASGAEGDSFTENSADKHVQMYCNEQVLSPNMDLRTVKHFFWKQSADLTLQYKLLETEAKKDKRTSSRSTHSTTPRSY